MNKYDLEHGMVVETKCGYLLLLCVISSIEEALGKTRKQTLFVFHDLKKGILHGELKNYNDDLTHNHLDFYDVIKVYKDYTLKEVLWQRN